MFFLSPRVTQPSNYNNLTEGDFSDVECYCRLSLKHRDLKRTNFYLSSKIACIARGTPVTVLDYFPVIYNSTPMIDLSDITEIIITEQNKFCVADNSDIGNKTTGRMCDLIFYTS